MEVNYRSIATIQNSINQIEKEIFRFDKSLADELKKETDKQKKISDLQSSMSKSKSESVIKSKFSQIQRYGKEIVGISKKKTDTNKKIINKRSKLLTLNQQLKKEQNNEMKKERKNQDDIRKSYEKRIQMLTQQAELAISNNFTSTKSSSVNLSEEIIEHDVFISHASEDKEGFVRELAEILKTKYEINVWYDEFSIQWGDSLRSVIDKGLANSRYGIVVISRNFIKKGWTNYELDGLFQIEMTNGKTVLPIWHDITKDEVQKFSPSLAGRKALNTAMFTVDEIAVLTYG